MSQFKNVSPDGRFVGWGTPPRHVLPGEVITVVADADEGYDCQPTIWEPVDKEAFAARQAARQPVVPSAVEAAQQQVVDTQQSLVAAETPEEIEALQAKLDEDAAALAHAQEQAAGTDETATADAPA